MDAHDTYLVLTFSGETRVLGMNAGVGRGLPMNDTTFGSLGICLGGAGAGVGMASVRGLWQHSSAPSGCASVWPRAEWRVGLPDAPVPAEPAVPRCALLCPPGRG